MWTPKTYHDFIWLAVLTLGIPGNILSAIVWLRRHVVSKNSSAVYLAALAVVFNNINNIRLIRLRQAAQPYIRYTVQHTIVCHAGQQCNGTHTVTQDSNNQVILGLAHRM